MNPWQIVRQIAPCVQIAHHIAGRIRLRLLVADIADDGRPRPSPAAVRAALETIDGVRSVRINLLARSCTVEYDETLIPPTSWNDLLTGTESPAANVLLDALRAKYETLTDTSSGT